MASMTIGRLAKEAGVNIDTIRYYERNGLIPEPGRRPSGYREYEAADCPGHGDLERCPIVAALSGETRQ
jgi:hypothetical protein